MMERSDDRHRLAHARARTAPPRLARCALALLAALLASTPAVAQQPVHAVMQIHHLDPADDTVIRTDSYALADPGDGSVGDWAGRWWVQQDPAVVGAMDPLVVVGYETVSETAGSRQSRFAVLRFDGIRFLPVQFMDVGPGDNEIFFLRVFEAGGALFMEIYEGTDPTIGAAGLDAHDYHWDGAAFVEDGIRAAVDLPVPLESLPVTPAAEMRVGIGAGEPFAVTTNSSIPGGSRVHLVDVPSPEFLSVEADPKGGIYAATLPVALSANSPTATIRYTTDGSDPDAGSPVFDPTRPIYVLPFDAAGNSQPSVTLSFQATEPGWLDSPIVRETYQVLQAKAADTDGDGLIDLWEAGRCLIDCRLDDGAGGCVIPAAPDHHCFDPLVPDADVDCDQDGWSDFDELRLGSDPTCGGGVPLAGSDARRVRFSGTAALPDGGFVTAASSVEAISPRGSDILLHATAPATDPVTDPSGVFTDVPTRGEADLILRIVDVDEPQIILHRFVPYFSWGGLLPARIFADDDFTDADDWFSKYAAALQYDVGISSLIADARSSTVLQLVEHTIETRLPELVLDHIGIPIGDVDRPPLGDFPGPCPPEPCDFDFGDDGLFERIELILGEENSGLTGQEASVLDMHGSGLSLVSDTIQWQAEQPGSDCAAWVAFSEDVFRAVPLEPAFFGTTDEVLTRVLDDPSDLDPSLAALIDSLPPGGGGGASIELESAGGREADTLPADLPGLVAAAKAAASTTADIFAEVVSRGETALYESGDAFATGSEYREIVGAVVTARSGDLAALADIAAGAEIVPRAVEEARLLAASGRIDAVQNLRAGVDVLAAALDAADGDPTAIANLGDRIHEVVYRIDRAEADPAALADLEANASDFLVPDVVPPIVTAIPSDPLFNGILDVSLVSDEPATIYYTLDGSDPLPGDPSTYYGVNEITGIAITEDTTVSWLGRDEPWLNESGISRITYLLDTDSDGVADIDDNCPLVANAGQEDFDGDLIGNACDPNDDNDPLDDNMDCRPLDPTLWAAPGETPITLSFTDQDSLGWTSLAAAAGPATVYDLARGPLDDLHGGQPPGNEFDGAICLTNDVGALSWDDADMPAAGEGFYYLVRGDNLCGMGSYGRTSDGVERLTLACP